MELSWKYQYTFCESLQLLYPHPQAFCIVGILQLEKCQMVLSQLRPWSRSPLTSGSTLVPNSVPASTWIFPHFICHTAARVMFVTFESDYPTLLLKSSNPYFPLSLSANWVTYFVCVCIYIPNTLCTRHSSFALLPPRTRRQFHPHRNFLLCWDTPW